MSTLFVSHSSQDDGFVHALQTALDDCGLVTWTDSRKLCGGEPLWSKIQQAIDEAEAFAVVVSPRSLQSKWTGKELRDGRRNHPPHRDPRKARVANTATRRWAPTSRSRAVAEYCTTKPQGTSNTRSSVSTRHPLPVEW
jgi:hypothetical protein